MKIYPCYQSHPFLSALLAATLIIWSLSGCIALGDPSSSLPAVDPDAVIESETGLGTPPQIVNWPADAVPIGKLAISTNQRYLVDQEGRPFFWLADTAWELFRRLNRVNSNRYLRDRSQKGFTVIQAAIVSPLGGWTKPNAAGESPFYGDVTMPNEAYFAHVDHVTKEAQALGLVMALLPTWGNHALSGQSQLSTADNAYEYGRYLGRRYQTQDNIVWVLGGDANPQETAQVWRDLARGLRETSTHLITFHPFENMTSATSFHEEAWLDFNMLQSGQSRDNKNYEVVLAEYQRMSAKPIVDGGHHYENTSEIAQLGKQRITAHQVRKAAYNALLSGAFGHTYGANEIWQFSMQNDEDGDSEDGNNNADLYGANTHWTEALDFAGARQMGYLRTLFERYPWYEFKPIHGLIRQDNRADGEFFPAAVSVKNEAVIIYIPMGQTIELAIHDPSLIEQAEWFDPRVGEHSRVESGMIQANRFTPPLDTDALDADPDAVDFVLILKTSLSATGKNAPIPDKSP